MKNKSIDVSLSPAPGESPSVLLEQYAQEANDHQAEAMEFARQAKSKTTEAVKSALLAGQALARARELCLHGEWGAWLEKNWKYTQETARKLIAVSKSNTDWNLTEGKTLQQLYIEAGVVDEKKPQERAPRSITERLSDFLGLLEGKREKIVPAPNAEEREAFFDVCAKIKNLISEILEGGAA